MLWGLPFKSKNMCPEISIRRVKSFPVASPSSFMAPKVVSISYTKDESSVQEFAFFLQYGP